MIDYAKCTHGEVIAHAQVLDMQLNNACKEIVKLQYRVAELEAQLREEKAFGVSETYAMALSKIAELDRQLEAQERKETK